MESVDPQNQGCKPVSESSVLPRWTSMLRARAGTLRRCHSPGGACLGKGSLCGALRDTNLGMLGLTQWKQKHKPGNLAAVGAVGEQPVPGTWTASWTAATSPWGPL